jgi:hypothetical protein
MACRLAKTNGIAVVRYDGHQLQFAGINGELANFTIIKEGALIDD